VKRIITISSSRKPGFIEFENGAVGDNGKSAVSHKTEIPEEDFLTQILSTEKGCLLPANVRWISADQRSMLLEEPPGYKSIQFRNAGKNTFTKLAKIYELPHPWLVYGISPGTNGAPYVSHLYAQRASLDINSDILFLASPFPNVFINGRICTHVLMEDDIEGIPYHALVNRAIDDFWSSVFNLDVKDFSRTRGYRYMYEKSVGMGSRDPFAYWASCGPEEFDNVPMDTILTYNQLITDMLGHNDYYSMSVTNAGRMMSEFLVASMKNS
jgi:hypothetical protein